ncbi:hypothetical protein PM082_005447 [Marasmius tenuissimus]|nr:hypothetical protein PM082_005447 [Marasmius tenuissimus]
MDDKVTFKKGFSKRPTQIERGAVRTLANAWPNDYRGVSNETQTFLVVVIRRTETSWSTLHLHYPGAVGLEMSGAVRRARLEAGLVSRHRKFAIRFDSVANNRRQMFRLKERHSAETGRNLA